MPFFYVTFQPYNVVEKAAVAAGMKPGDGTEYRDWVDEFFGSRTRFAGDSFQAALRVAKTLAPIDLNNTVVIAEREWTLGPKRGGRQSIVRLWVYNPRVRDPIESEPIVASKPKAPEIKNDR